MHRRPLFLLLVAVSTRITLAFSFSLTLRSTRQFRMSTRTKMLSPKLVKVLDEAMALYSFCTGLNENATQQEIMALRQREILQLVEDVSITMMKPTVLSGRLDEAILNASAFDVVEIAKEYMEQSQTQENSEEVLQIRLEQLKILMMAPRRQYKVEPMLVMVSDHNFTQADDLFHRTSPEDEMVTTYVPPMLDTFKALDSEQDDISPAKLMVALVIAVTAGFVLMSKVPIVMVGATLSSIVESQK